MKTILVVDDEFGIAEALSSLLSDEGYRVVIAMNGKTALERLEETPPDLILLDFMMPILDGPETFRRIRADQRFRDLPIVIMSAVPEANVQAEIPDYAAFLRKPFQAVPLLRVIRDLLGNDER